MPDITMCKGTNCPLKQKCYRFLAKPDEWQAFFFEPPVKKNGTCEHFLNIYIEKKNK